MGRKYSATGVQKAPPRSVTAPQAGTTGAAGRYSAADIVQQVLPQVSPVQLVVVCELSYYSSRLPCWNLPISLPAFLHNVCQDGLNQPASGAQCTSHIHGHNCNVTDALV